MKNRTLSVKARILFLGGLVGAAFVSLPSAQTATITVTNTNDSGAGSLRQALADANNGDTIDFDSSLNGRAITLISGELLINKSLTINGPDANDLTVRSNGASRVFHVTGGVTATIARLALTNGRIIATGGGGIYNERSTLTVSNCTLRGNSAPRGGGIYNDGSGFGPSATLSVLDSTLSGNSAGPSGAGAGIYNDGSGEGSATLSVSNCTLSGNQVIGIRQGSSGSGGGIHNNGSGKGSATLSVSNSTLSGNSVLGVTGTGGGIFNEGDLSILNSTLSRNQAHSGGGIYNTAEGRLGNNIFDTSPIRGSIGMVSIGYNLSSDNGGGILRGNGDRINTNPLLGALQNNGGPTFTHALLPGSPAINAGNPIFTPPPDYDQRGPGFDRVVNGRIDIGSFEVQAIPTATPTPTPEPRPTPTPRPTASPH